MANDNQTPRESRNEGARGPEGQHERHKKDEGRVHNRSPNEPDRASEKGDANRREGGPGQRAAGEAPGDTRPGDRSQRTERRP